MERPGHLKRTFAAGSGGGSRAELFQRGQERGHRPGAKRDVAVEFDLAIAQRGGGGQQSQPGAGVAQIKRGGLRVRPARRTPEMPAAAGQCGKDCAQSGGGVARTQGVG
ncbi:hypothetical protein SDC9_207121 [bioreactor metagenome]|uniref:Uncharacterized protein n=1 Tax=bioreactor metagenome TaxID=1076179 RepID=A0A645J8C7_9ZZZZ